MDDESESESLPWEKNEEGVVFCDFASKSTIINLLTMQNYSWSIQALGSKPNLQD
jgi:hypothetical protein